MPEIRFLVGDLIDPADPVDAWITGVSMGLNDLILSNRRLLGSMDDEATPTAETLYDAKLVAACVWEISKFLRESENTVPEVAESVQQLPAHARSDYQAALAPTDPATPDTWFIGKLATARDAASHYPELSRKNLAKAIRKISDKEGTITLGEKVGTLRVGFADAVDVELFFQAAPDQWEADFRRFIRQLAEVVQPLMRFLRTALLAHLDRHEGKWTISS